MAIVQGSFGKVRAFIDLLAEEVPVAGTVQSPIILSGGFKLIGEGNNADDGLVLQSALNGVGRLTTTDEDTEGMSIATEVAFDPGKMGTLVMEARVALPALTARSVFVGFGGVAGDVLIQVVTGATTTITYGTEGANICGFLFDSQLTALNWHMVHKGGVTAAATDATAIDSKVAPVANEFDILRVEIDNDGTTRWFVNGDLKQTVKAAASTSVNLAAICGVFATTTTVATLDVDYVAAEGNRYWDRSNA